MAQKMLWQCDCCDKEVATAISAEPPEGYHIVELVELGSRLASKSFIWCDKCYAFVLGSKDGTSTALGPALPKTA